MSLRSNWCMRSASQSAGWARSPTTTWPLFASSCNWSSRVVSPRPALLNKDGLLDPHPQWGWNDKRKLSETAYYMYVCMCVCMYVLCFICTVCMNFWWSVIFESFQKLILNYSAPRTLRTPKKCSAGLVSSCICLRVRLSNNDWIFSADSMSTPSW